MQIFPTSVYANSERDIKFCKIRILLYNVKMNARILLSIKRTAQI